MLCSNNIHSQIILDTALENIGNHQNSNQSKFTFNIKKNPTKNITNTIIITTTKEKIYFHCSLFDHQGEKGKKGRRKKSNELDGSFGEEKHPPSRHLRFDPTSEKM